MPGPHLLTIYACSELHWHLTAEWAYVLTARYVGFAVDLNNSLSPQGTVRVTAATPDGQNYEADTVSISQMST
jgi:hypothetical protein